MKRTRAASTVAAVAALAIGVTACGGNSTSPTKSAGGSDNAPSYNAGVGKVFNASATKHGIVCYKFGYGSAIDNWQVTTP